MSERVIKVETTSSGGPLEVIQQVAVILAAVAVPLVLGYFGNRLEADNSRREQDLRYLDMSVGILAEPLRDDDEADVAMREWAGSVLQATTPVPLPEATLQALVTGQKMLPVLAIAGGGPSPVTGQENTVAVQALAFARSQAEDAASMRDELFSVRMAVADTEAQNARLAEENQQLRQFFAQLQQNRQNRIEIDPNELNRVEDAALD